MTNISFVYRWGEDPTQQKIFQERRARFLQDGSISITDGNNWERDESGEWAVDSSYALVRPAVAGEPLQMRFRRGRIEFYDTTTTHLPLTSSPTHQFLDGRITILETPALGALSDFAFWVGGGSADPASTYVESGTDIDSGGVTQAATRHHAIFVPHRNARYLAVGARVYSVPNTGTHRSQYFKKWMLEKVEVGKTTPTGKYAEAREVRVKVRPDRLNYSTNPAFQVDTTDWTGVTRTANTGSRTGWSGNIFVTAAAGIGWATHTVSSLLPTHTYLIQVEVDSVGGSAPTITPSVSGATLVRPAATQIAEFGKTLVSVLVRPDAVGTPVEVTYTIVPSQSTDTTVRFYYAQIEKMDDVVDLVPFDGATSADTIWESGGTPGKSRSYLYKNRADRYAAIKRVLKDNVPLGIGIAEPQFGTLPPD